MSDTAQEEKLRGAVARKLCEQHGGDADAVATEEHDCWEGALWKVFLADADAILSLIASSPMNAVREGEELRGKLRMIVSHATGGASQDIDASINDICVEITRRVNRVWEHAQEAEREACAKVVEAFPSRKNDEIAQAIRSRTIGGEGNG